MDDFKNRSVEEIDRNKINPHIIGSNIRMYRKTKGLTQKQLSFLSGIGESAIRMYELGARIPRLEQLTKIAKTLEVNLLQLMDMNIIEQDILKLEISLPSTGECITVENLIQGYEGNNTPVNPIGIEACTCPNCGTQNDVIKKRRNTVLMDIVYCWHCSQPLMITNQ